MAHRFFAIVPAAGHSSRMGCPKLLLPLNDRPLILHTLAGWLHSAIDSATVVVRPGDEPLRTVLQVASAATPTRLHIVVPQHDPSDMKASLQIALVHIEQVYQPQPDDAFLVAPADMPQLSSPIINRLVDYHRSQRAVQILVPTLNSRRGHPVLFPWRFAAEVHQLAASDGLNAIVDRNQVTYLPCDDLLTSPTAPFLDVDTPEEYERIIASSDVDFR